MIEDRAGKLELIRVNQKLIFYQVKDLEVTRGTIKVRKSRRDDGGREMSRRRKGGRREVWREDGRREGWRDNGRR